MENCCNAGRGDVVRWAGGVAPYQRVTVGQVRVGGLEGRDKDRWKLGQFSGHTHPRDSH